MTVDLISKKQSEILLFVNKYVKSMKNKINVANSAICYFHNYGDYLSSSYLKLKFYGYKYLIKFIINFLKNLYSTSEVENYVCEKNQSKKKFKNLVISHVSKHDFLRDGSYIDKYFNFHSKNYKDCVFFLNSVDGYSPKKIQDNIIIFKKKKINLTKKKRIKNFLIFFFKNKFSFIKIFHEYNFLSQFSKKIYPHLISLVHNNDLKKILLFYEAQPYQNNFINELRKKKIIVETVGLYHSGLLPLHTSLIFRDGAPNKLLISGNIQKKYCEKYLGWPKNRVHNVYSFRYNKNSIRNTENTIYLPYAISKSNNVLQSLAIFFEKSKTRSLPNLLIKNHPATLNSKKHLLLIKNIKEIIKKNKIKFGNKFKKISIFIGSTTSITLALEQKIDVIHISEDPIFDTFNSKIWNDLIVTRLDRFIFKYKLKENKNILKITNSNKNKIQKYLN